MNKIVSLVLGIVLIAVSPLIILTNTAYTLMLPNIYESSCRVLVNSTEVQGGCDAPCPHCSLGTSSFLETQIEIIQSKPILYEVIKRLNLQSEWGLDGEMLPRTVAYQILQNSSDVFQHRDTSMIVVSVKRDNPAEAASIANELVETYRDSRQELQGKEALEIVEIAEPNYRPVSPNLFLNVLISIAVAGVFTVTGSVLIIIAATRKKD